MQAHKRSRPWEPRKVDDIKTLELHMLVMDNPAPYAVFAETIMQAGWIIRAAEQVCGWCYYDYRTIIIPTFVWKDEEKGLEGSIIYYLSHELAHAKAGHKAKHGPLFMEAFKSLCPKEYWHYEFEYKPSYALAAGIVPEDF